MILSARPVCAAVFLSIGGAAAPALGQVVFSTATRSVAASDIAPGWDSPHVVMSTTRSLGTWDQTVDARTASAWQRSSISGARIESQAWCRTQGVPGHTVTATSDLAVLVTFGDDCRWDASVGFEGGSTTAGVWFTRVEDGADMTPGVTWDRAGDYSGMLRAGAYRVRTLMSTSAGESSNYSVTVDFSTVPAPAGLAVLAALPVLTRRRRAG